VKASGDVGIWHETDLVPAGRYEASYGTMPRIGLAAAAGRSEAAHGTAPPPRHPLQRN
jgi:hypothetical protein